MESPLVLQEMSRPYSCQDQEFTAGARSHPRACCVSRCERVTSHYCLCVTWTMSAIIML